MKNLYLSLAIAGAVVPYVFFVDFINLNGIDIFLFIKSLFVNGASAGFTADLLISSVIFWLFMFNQQKKANALKPYFFTVINLLIGLSCDLPAYLYVREIDEV